MKSPSKNRTQGETARFLQCAMKSVAMVVPMSLFLGCGSQRHSQTEEITITRGADEAIVSHNESMTLTLRYDEEGFMFFGDPEESGAGLRATISRDGKNDRIIITRKWIEE